MKIFLTINISILFLFTNYKLFAQIPPRIKFQNLPDIRGSIGNGSFAIPNTDDVNQGYGIYLNPAHDELTISLEGEFELETVSIFNITGEKVYHNNHSGISTVINVRDIKSGIYFISILKSDGEYLNNKIIID